MATFTDATKHVVTFINQSANSVTMTPLPIVTRTYYLTTEAGDKLITESSSYLITEQAAPGSIFNNLSKS